MFVFSHIGGVERVRGPVDLPAPLAATKTVRSGSSSIVEPPKLMRDHGATPSTGASASGRRLHTPMCNRSSR